MVYIRQGECNKCGQCCGANGENPWPRGYPDMFYASQASAVYQSFPLSILCGVTGKNGERATIQTSGEATINGACYPYEWGAGLHKPGNTECPFLNDDMTCALYGTEYHWIWEQLCKPQPPENFSKIHISGNDETAIKNWFEQFPKCSYEYIEVIE